MKFASFDLESAEAFPEEMDYSDTHFKLLGITCAAVALIDTSIHDNWSDNCDVTYWYSDNKNKMDKESCCILVNDLYTLAKDGYTFITWNGTSFDFRLLAIESGMYHECTELAYKFHIDMMLFIVFIKGHYLALQTALEGIGAEGKLKEVRLSDGTIINDMKGALAPELWRKGEYKAVLEYLKYDVVQPLKLLQFIYNKRKIQWISKKGNFQICYVPKVYTVNKVLKNYTPHTFWDSSGITLEKFTGWMD